MRRFHISQDETGFFQITFENDHGDLSLVAYQLDSARHAVEDALDLAESAAFLGAVVVVDPRRHSHTAALGATALAAPLVTRPAPRKAGV